MKIKVEKFIKIALNRNLQLFPLLLIFMSCNLASNQANFSEIEQEFKQIFGEDGLIKKNGFISANWRSDKNNQKLAFNVNEVDFNSIVIDTYRGCEENCPPKIIITIECTDHSDCLFSALSHEQAYGYTTFEFLDVKEGEIAFQFLENFKEIQKQQ